MKTRFWLLIPLLFSACVSPRFSVSTAQGAEDSPAIPEDPSSGWSEVWSHSLGAGAFGGLAVSRDRLAAAGEDGVLQVLNLDGTLLWKTPLGGPLGADPLWVGDRLIAATQDGVVRAFEGDSGREIWSQKVPGVKSGLCWAGESLFLPSLDGKLNSLSLAGGALNWSVDAGPAPRLSPWTFWAGGAWTFEDLVVLADGSGRVRAWNGATGELQWTSGPWKMTHPQTPGQWTPLMTEAGLAVFLSRRAAVVLNPRNGDLIKNIELPRELGTVPAAAGSRLYLPLRAGSKHAAAWDLSTGKPLWEATMPRANGSWLNTAAVDGHFVWVGGSDSKRFYLVDAETGKLLGQQKLTSRVWSAPVRQGNLLWVLTEDGRIGAWDVGMR